MDLRKGWAFGLVVAIACAAGLVWITSGASAKDAERGAASSILVDIDGTGSGKVTSDKGGIDCPDACMIFADAGETYVLTATANPGNLVASISGDCASTTATSCTLVAEPGRSVVTVTFEEGAAGGDTPCDKAKAALAAKKAKLNALKDSGASAKQIKKAKKAVKKAKAKVKKKC
jgi:hypothetical protein